MSKFGQCTYHIRIGETYFFCVNSSSSGSSAVDIRMCEVYPVKLL